MSEHRPTLAIIGSYRREDSLAVIKETFEVMERHQVPILLPPAPRPIDPRQQYVRFQDRMTAHLSDEDLERFVNIFISLADVVYVSNPGGRIGAMTSYELGHTALLEEKPTYFRDRPLLPILRSVPASHIVTPQQLAKLITSRSYRPLVL